MIIQAVFQCADGFSNFSRDDHHHAALGSTLSLFLLPPPSHSEGEPPLPSLSQASLCVLMQTSYVFGPDGVEEDAAVRQLATDLKNIDLVMVAVLSQEKYRYLFEGVGHIVAAVFISSTNYIRTINTNGVKKM